MALFFFYCPTFRDASFPANAILIRMDWLNRWSHLDRFLVGRCRLACILLIPLIDVFHRCGFGRALKECILRAAHRLIAAYAAFGIQACVRWRKAVKCFSAKDATCTPGESDR